MKLNITHLYGLNNYPRKFVQTITHYNLHKRKSSNLSGTNNSKGLFIDLKYARQTREQLVSRMKKIVHKSLEDGVKMKIVYNLLN